MSEPFLEALFHELGCIMLWLSGLPLQGYQFFWSLLLLGEMKESCSGA